MRLVPPDKALVFALSTPARQEVLGLALSRNLFRGPEIEPTDSASGREVVPNECVFVLTQGGEPPMPTHDGANELVSAVNVRVRSDVDRFEDGQDLAREVWWAVHHEDLGAGYIECECLESEPRYLGRGDAGHHRWDVTLRVTRKEAP